VASFSHLNAPSTKMVDIKCACCSTPLVDGKSLAIGMGPHCRKKHGYNKAMLEISESQRVVANKIIHAISVQQQSPAVVAMVNELRALHLALAPVADRIAKRLAAVTVETLENGSYSVRVSYDADLVSRWRSIPGRRWEGDKKVNLVPATSRKELWSMLTETYAGKNLWAFSSGKLVTL